jgi:hypothetical protein
MIQIGMLEQWNAGILLLKRIAAYFKVGFLIYPSFQNSNIPFFQTKTACPPEHR